LFYFYPDFVKHQLPLDEKQHELRNQMAKDYLFLKSMLAEPFQEKGRGKIFEIMKEFFAVQEADTTLYTGLVLLDKNRKVYSAYSRDTGASTATKVGSSYGGISFKGDKDSIYRVLSLYRVDEDHPMGRPGIEVAFEMKIGNRPLGWLVFQMDTEMLQKKYGLDDKGLKRFRFTGP
jgi:hypothetical protein